jgi:uncharacterized membrane protein
MKATLTNLRCATPFIARLGYVVVATLTPVWAHAATFNDMFQNLEQQFGGASTFLMALGVIVGLALFVFGLIKLASVHKSHDSKAIPVVMMLVGVGLMSITFVISMASSSTLGSGADTTTNPLG